MRFVYRWNDIDEMSDAVHDLWKVSNTWDDDIDEIFWVPSHLAAAFQQSDEYKDAINKYGHVHISNMRMIEHNGFKQYGSFYVVYHS